MNIFTILLFFIYTWGLGYTTTRFLRNSDNFLERNLMRIGIGLGIIPFLGVLINLLHIPIDWKIFLIISLVLPLVDIFRSKKLFHFKLRLTKSNISILIVLLLFFASLFMYVSGAFKYPWLEDDDPWSHALSIKYVALEKDVFNSGSYFQYIDPYPPGYDLLFGILHQTSPSLSWTMKFFNALIISLGIVFFYFFARRFIGNRNKALFATFILASIPIYLSHFIWAHSLVVTLFFPAMYCIEMLKEDKKWLYPSILIIASISLTQPTQPIKFAVLFGIYFLIQWIASKKFNLRLLISLFGGYFLSIIWWFNHWRGMLISGARPIGTGDLTASTSFITKIGILIQKVFPYDLGTATKAYSFNEIFFAKHQNMINNPIGIGLFISLLLLISIIFLILRYRNLLDKKKTYLSITLVWAIFTFLGFNSMTFNLPIGFFAFRFWMLFAIPASILAAEGLWFLFSVTTKFGIPKIIILVIVIIGVIFTSAHQKYSVNTAVWGFGAGWTSYEEIQGYVWMRENLPVDTPVFTFTQNHHVIGFDMFSCEWCSDINNYRETAINQTIDSLRNWLKAHGYEYIIVDGKSVREYGMEFINNKTQEMLSSGKFRAVHRTNGAIIMKII